MRPKIKIDYQVKHIYAEDRVPYGPVRGHTVARVSARISYMRCPMYETPWRQEESVVIAEKRYDWNDGFSADDSEVAAAKWAIEGVAEVFKKLWPKRSEES